MPLPSGVYAAAVTPRRPGTGEINLGVMWDLFDFLCERKIARHCPARVNRRVYPLQRC